LIDKAGRRILLIISDSGMAVGLLGLGIFFYLKEQNSITLGEQIDYCGTYNSTGLETEVYSESSPEGLAWLPLASLMLFVLSFNFGFGPVPWLCLGELLPAHVKGNRIEICN
jgi:SP family facilitated glucose transporter-like MFS transporter 8